MKVAFVSVFPPNTNGIGDYTLDLARAISARGADVVVLADRAGDSEVDVEVDRHSTSLRDAARHGEAVAIDRCWTPRGDFGPDVLAAAARARPDVVHLQHGGYMGRDARVPALLEGLRARGIRTAITLHGVYPQRHRSLLRPSKWSPLRFHRALGAASDRIVIHHKAGALDPLVDHGVDAARVAIIPHGTPAVPALDSRAARERLGLPLDRPLALFLGFIEYSKGVDTVARGFGDVAAAVPGALLVIAGRIEQHDLQDRLYRYSLERHVRAGRRAGWIEFRPGYLPADDVPAYLAAADVVVFPYRQQHGSASGILHRTFAAGRAVVCSRGPKFVDAAEALGADAGIVLPPAGDAPAWSNALARVLGDPELRARIAGVTAELGRRSAWPVVADQHLALYDELMSARPG